MAFWNRKKIEKKYRILSIDGGGMKGIFTAYAIWKLEEEFDIKIQDHFDMIVGTSTGALIASGLLVGKSAKEIYDTYIDKDNKIFAERKKLTEQLTSTFYAQFEHSQLEEELIKQFGDKTLEDLYKISKKDFAFFSSNFTKGKPVIYSSPTLKKSEMVIQDAKVFEALRTSTSAPFYFEPFKQESTEHLLLDGGLWANNPTLSAIALAAAVYDFDMGQIEVLSFGQTFTSDLTFELFRGKELLKNPAKNQLAQLLMSVLTISINSQTEMAENLLGDKVFRYAPEVEQKKVSVSEVNTKFVNYTKVYWQENKDSLVEFIKTGKNIKNNKQK